jgi:cell fate regulator YaaT (PSP1 superfamily)
MSAVHDYLLSYGNAGDFGRFHSTTSLSLRRGARAVIRSPRGLEFGTVLCPTNPAHAAHLPNTSVGQLLRLANADDEQSAQRMKARARNIFNDGRKIAADLSLSIELLDVEVLLDGEHACLYHLRWAECDVRPLVSSLSKQHDLHIELQDLSRAPEGCGRPNCGRGDGGCSTCGSGGGCGTCGSHEEAEVQAYFSSLREKMTHLKRTPLL